MLAVVNDFLTVNWVELIKYPELDLTQARQLLSGARKPLP